MENPLLFAHVALAFSFYFVIVDWVFLDVVVLGKTVPSYRMALEFELENWKNFKKSLLTDEEKQAFEEIADMARSHASAAGNACRPILFEPMALSILLGQQKRIRTLQRKIDALLVSRLSEESNPPKRQGEIK